MATDSFKFWDSYYDALRMLGSDERRGQFVMALCSYVFDGEEPDFDGDEVMAFGFQLVATQAMESKELAARKREGGIKSGIARRAKSKTKSVPNTLPNEKKREEAKGNEASSLPNESDSAGAGADAPPPLP